MTSLFDRLAKKWRIHLSEPWQLVGIYFLSFAIRYFVLIAFIPYDTLGKIQITDEATYSMFIKGLLQGDINVFSWGTRTVRYSPVTPFLLLLPYLIFTSLGIHPVVSTAIAGVLLASFWPLFVFKTAKALGISPGYATLLALVNPFDIADVLTWSGYSLELTILSVAIFVYVATKRKYWIAALVVFPSMLAHRTGLLYHLTAFALAIVWISGEWWLEKHHRLPSCIQPFSDSVTGSPTSSKFPVSATSSSSRSFSLSSLFLFLRSPGRVKRLKEWYASHMRRWRWIPLEGFILLLGLILSIYLIGPKIQENLKHTLSWGSWFSPWWLIRFTGFLFVPLVILGAWHCLKTWSPRNDLLGLYLYFFTSVIFMCVPIWKDPALITRFISASAAVTSLLAAKGVEWIEKQRVLPYSRLLARGLLLIIAVTSIWLGVTRSVTLRTL